MAASRSETQTETRARLLSAAHSEIARTGVSASVRDIAAAAGLTQGALYAQFGSKQVLLLELLRDHMLETAGRIEAMLAGLTDGPSAMATIARWASTIAKTADWSAVTLELQLHASREPKFAAEYDRVVARANVAFGRVISRVFTLHQQKSELAPEVLARSLLAMSHGLALDRGSDPGAVVVAMFRWLLKSAKR